MITFKQTKPRLWNGNGMGYSSAEYDLVHDGRIVGRMFESCGDWRVTLTNGPTLRPFSGKQADAKDMARKHFATGSRVMTENDRKRIEAPCPQHRKQDKGKGHRE